MEHIKFLFSVIIFLSGLYVTFYVNTLRKKYRFSYMSMLTLYMLIVTLLFSILMFAIYFKLNLPRDFLFNRSSATGNLISIAIYVLFFSLIYLMFLIVSAMLGIKPGIRYQVILILVMVFALVIELIHVFLPALLKANKFFLFVYDNFVDNFIFLEIILLVVARWGGFCNIRTNTGSRRIRRRR